jgi:hypothetical protein
MLPSHPGNHAAVQNVSFLLPAQIDCQGQTRALTNSEGVASLPNCRAIRCGSQLLAVDLHPAKPGQPGSTALLLEAHAGRAGIQEGLGSRKGRDPGRAGNDCQV